MSNLEQPADDGGTAGVAVLNSGREDVSTRLVSSQRSIIENAQPHEPRAAQSTFDSPVTLLESEPLERVLEARRGEVAGTAFNLAAEAVSRGMKVLYIGRTAASCDAVLSAAREAGLSEIALSVAGRNGSGLEAAKELRRTLKLGPPVETDLRDSKGELIALSTQVEAQFRGLGKEIRNTGVTGYEALATSLGVKAGAVGAEISALSFQTWDGSTFERARSAARELDGVLRSGGSPGSNPWRGSSRDAEAVPVSRERLQEVAQKLSSYGQGLRGFLSSLGFVPTVTENETDKILQALKIIDGLETGSGESLRAVNIRSPGVWIRDREEIVAGLENQIQLADAIRKLEGRVDFKRLRSLDLHATSKAALAFSEKGAVGRFFDGEFRAARVNLERVAKMPEDIGDLLKVLGHLEVLQKMFDQADERSALWSNLFPGGNAAADDLPTWRQRAQIAYALIEIFTLCDGLSDADSRSVIGVLRNPGPLYEQTVSLQEACTLGAEMKKLRNAVLEEAGFSEAEQERGFFSKTLDEQEKRFRALAENDESWKSWRQFLDVWKRATDAGVEPLAAGVAAGKITKPNLESGVKLGWYKALAEEAASTKAGSDEEAPARSERMRRLLELDSKVRDENALRVAQTHWKAAPRFVLGGQSAALYRLLGEDSPPESAGAFIENAPLALQHVKPLIITDEKSAERILSKGGIEFDLVLLESGVHFPDGHPVRAKVTARRVVEVSGRASSGADLHDRSLEADQPRADWLVGAVGASSVRDPFQAHLKRILEESVELSVRTDVKTSHGTVDLALFDSRGRCRLGILLDSPELLGGSSVLERESNREKAVLELTRLPPRREWILDWYRKPAVCKRSLLAEIERTLRNTASPSAATARREIQREPLRSQHLQLLKPYEKATIDLTDLRARLRSQGELRPKEVSDALVQIVAREGPIHRDELAQRFVECCGLRVLNDQLALQVVEGEQAALKHKKLFVKDDFLYSSKDPDVLHPRTRGDLSGTLARFERISPEELEAAICLVVKCSYGLPRSELSQQLIRALGYKGAPFGADAVTERTVAELLTERVLEERDGVLWLGQRAKLS